MKNLLCLLMALVMMLTLSACKFPWQKSEDPREDPKEETETPKDEDGDGIPDLVLPGDDDGKVVLPIVPVVPK